MCFPCTSFCAQQETWTLIFTMLLVKSFLIQMWSILSTKVAGFVWPTYFLAVFRNKCACIVHHRLALKWVWGKQLINHIWIIDISDIALQGLPSLIYTRALFFMELLEYLSLNNVFMTKPQTQSQYFFSSCRSTVWLNLYMFWEHSDWMPAKCNEQKMLLKQ